MYHGERFNGYSHLSGAVLALSGAVVLVAVAPRGDAWKVTSLAIYGTSLVLLYSLSTLYHSTRGKIKDFFRRLDHSAIYLLIAGTYTPFALVTLRGPWGWSLLGVVWGLALAGIAQELWLERRRGCCLSLPIYVLMGWIGLIAIVPLVQALGWAGFAWVAAGGAIYTAGIVVYLFDEKFTHWHGVWHLCVVGGSAVHYFAILLYVA